MKNKILISWQMQMKESHTHGFLLYQVSIQVFTVSEIHQAIYPDASPTNMNHNVFCFSIR